MGMFDEVTISDKAWKKLGLDKMIGSWAKCGQNNFQTKDLECGLYNYYLDLCYDDKVRLFLIKPPNKEKYWEPYTKSEFIDLNQKIEELKKKKKEKKNLNDFRILLLEQELERGGNFKKEAYLIKNRDKAIVEGLHQYILLYAFKSKDLKLKFTDSVCVSVDFVEYR